MPGFFYNLGRSVRAGVQKGKWIVQSLTGSEEEAIDAEHAAGVEIARAFEQDAAIDDDEAIAALLKDIGKALRKRVKSKRRKFKFKALAIAEPNAFALPGGFVYVTRGLIELCAGGEKVEGQGPRDEAAAPVTELVADSATPMPSAVRPSPSCLRDELAFILGHEMGHVVRGHAMQRMVNSSVVSAAAKAVPVGGALGKMIVQAGSQFLTAAYSQDNELEADEFGLRLARAAGFDESAAVTMMQRLQERGGDHPEDSLGAYFASHPPFRVRIRELRKLTR